MLPVDATDHHAHASAVENGAQQQATRQTEHARIGAPEGESVRHRQANHPIGYNDDGREVALPSSPAKDAGEDHRQAIKDNVTFWRGK